ncbi:MAG: hypothetical protein JWP97_2573 [Labilithrix sp.]|nr:hypothetical protein [Labilithrix sp.]
MTYWNETIAAFYGASIKQPGECVAGAAVCTSNTTGACTEGRSCNLSDKQCGGVNPITPGTCWGLPATCAGTAQYRKCGGLGPTGKCLTRCEAIRNEERYVQDGATCN